MLEEKKGGKRLRCLFPQRRYGPTIYSTYVQYRRSQKIRNLVNETRATFLFFCETLLSQKDKEECQFIHDVHPVYKGKEELA